MKNHSIQFRLFWTSFEIKLWTIEIISKHYIMWNNTGPNFIYFSTSSCLSLGQIELIKYLQFSFTLASSNSVLDWDGRCQNANAVGICLAVDAQLWLLIIEHIIFRAIGLWDYWLMDHWDRNYQTIDYQSKESNYLGVSIVEPGKNYQCPALIIRDHEKYSILHATYF